MRVVTTTKAAPAPKTTAAAKGTSGRLPELFIGPTLSRRLDKAIVKPESKPERQLKFLNKTGFVSPAGKQLQVVYLNKSAAPKGMGIAYVDSKSKQFWAQAAGTSGLARGPFKLPPGLDQSLARSTAKALAGSKQEPLRVEPKLVFRPTQDELRDTRRRLNDIFDGQ